jgi:hypothetical protein
MKPMGALAKCACGSANLVGGSGRYFMRLIAPETAGNLSPQTAVDYLNQLEWYLYSGSYFGKSGKSTTKIDADL